MNWFKTLIPTLGGFQFGYAVGVMSGAILFICSQFSLTPEQQGLVVSVFLMGTLPGAAVAGPIANWLGRKKTQQIIAILFFIGALILFTATTVPLIITGRVIQGLAAGAVAVVAPMYIAEVSLADRRGLCIGFYQLAVTSGIFVAYVVTLMLASTTRWEWMFVLGVIPALIHFFGFFSLPESMPKKNASVEKSSWKTLAEPGIRSVFIIVVLINVFQQITGVNAILYFAPSIFLACGFDTAAMALLPPIFMGVINVAMTVLAMRYLDTWGRRPLLLTGISGMTLSLIGLVIAFLSGDTTMKWLGTASIMIFTASFAMGLGPIPQLLGAELLPRRVRGQGVSIATTANWIFNFIVVFTFMDFTTRFSHAGTFAIYATFGVMALYFIWKYIPETKGRVMD